MQVIECYENYTSKTCGQCGWVNDKLNGAEKFKCQACGYFAGRHFGCQECIAEIPDSLLLCF